MILKTTFTISQDRTGYFVTLAYARETDALFGG